MRVDGPSTSVVGFANYTQKIAADAVNPDLVAASQTSESSSQYRVQSESSAFEASLKNREAVASDMVQVRSEAIEYSAQAAASAQAADEVRESFDVPAYEKGAIIDTFA